MPVQDLEALRRPLPAWHPKRWYFALARGLLQTVGRLSKGIRIGLEHGFDSGVMLDHVYANRAEGTGFLGRAIDRAYLNAAGWAGIRNRGALLEARIVGTIMRAAEDGGVVRVADLACGGGRYALNALARLGIDATIEQGDAFADADLDRLGAVDVAVVSGLHEIVDDDARVKNHVRQVARILRPGGTLLLTVQPDHPQLEFIARVLKSHTGKAWAMRLRPMELTRRWLEAAGFVVEHAEMEPLGIFGVVRARKA